MLDPFSPTANYEGIPGTEHSFDYIDKPRGWIEVGMFFQTYPPAHASWDKAIISAIHEFDPYFVPLWVEWVFKRPIDDSSKHEWKSFGRHVLARQEPDPRREKPPVKPLLQGFGKYVRPNVLLEILHDNRPDPKFHEEGELDLPGLYIPFSWAVWKGLRAGYEHANQKPGQRDLDKLDEWYEKDNKDYQSMLDDWKRDQIELSKFVQKKLDEIGETSALRHFKWVKEQERLGKFDPLNEKPLSSIN